LALGVVGLLGALAALALVASSFRATLAMLDVADRLVGGPKLDFLEEVLLLLASRAPGGELRAGLLEDGSLLVLPAVAEQCLVVPSAWPLHHLADSLLLVAQPLPVPIPHGPPGVLAEIREVTLYRLSQRGWERAREIPPAVLGGERLKRYLGTWSATVNRVGRDRG